MMRGTFSSPEQNIVILDECRMIPNFAYMFSWACDICRRQFRVAVCGLGLIS